MMSKESRFMKFLNWVDVNKERNFKFLISLVTGIIFFSFLIILIAPANVTDEEIIKYQEEAHKLHQCVETLEGENTQIVTVIDNIKYECTENECNISLYSNVEHIGKVVYSDESFEWIKASWVANTFEMLLAIILIFAVSFLFATIISFISTAIFFIILSIIEKITLKKDCN